MQNNASKSQLIRRFRTKHKLRCMRRIFSSWLIICNERSIMLKTFTEKHVLRTKSNVLAIWREQFELKRIEKCIAVADKVRQSMLKQSFFVKWRLTVKKSKSSDDAGKSKSNKIRTNPEQVSSAEQQDSSHCVLIPDEEDTPVKARAQTTSCCITPEKRASSDSSSPLLERKIECTDKENQKPNRTNNNSNKLLQPLKPQRKPLRNPTTPKLVKEMDQRKKEREKQREILRHRYEQKAIEKKRQLEEEKLRKEENELKVVNEYKQRKAEEEKRKALASARWKQACRLSILHYRMSLQRRMLCQWKKIFKIKSFNERKVRNETYVMCTFLSLFS